MSIKKLSGKLARKVKRITCCEGEPELSGPGCWFVGRCSVCNNLTQVATWLEKEGETLELCQLCLD